MPKSFLFTPGGGGAAYSSNGFVLLGMMLSAYVDSCYSKPPTPISTVDCIYYFRIKQGEVQMYRTEPNCLRFAAFQYYYADNCACILLYIPNGMGHQNKSVTFTFTVLRARLIGPGWTSWLLLALATKTSTTPPSLCTGGLVRRIRTSRTNTTSKVRHHPLLPMALPKGCVQCVTTIIKLHGGRFHQSNSLYVHTTFIL